MAESTAQLVRWAVAGQQGWGGPVEKGSWRHLIG